MHNLICYNNHPFIEIAIGENTSLNVDVSAWLRIGLSLAPLYTPFERFGLALQSGNAHLLLPALFCSAFQGLCPVAGFCGYGGEGFLECFEIMAIIQWEDTVVWSLRDVVSR